MWKSQGLGRLSCMLLRRRRRARSRAADGGRVTHVFLFFRVIGNKAIMPTRIHQELGFWRNHSFRNKENGK